MFSSLTNAYFQICSFVISTLLLFLYYSKKNVENKETKIYSKLIIVGFFESLIYLYICVAAHFIDVSSHYNFYIVLNKIIYLVYIIWFSFMYNYEINISFEEEKLLVAQKFMKVLYCLEAIIALLIILLPIEIYFDPNTGLSNSYGASSTALFIGMSLYVLSMFIVAIINFKSSFRKKYTPLFILIILMIVALIIRLVDPLFGITSNILSLTLLVMYFTIENPDVKMLNEVTLAKNQVEKSNKVKSEFISSMSHEIRTPLNAIVGYGQMIDFAENLDEAKENAKDIVNASNTLLNMLSNVLDISMVEVNELDVKEIEYNLSEIVNNVTNLFKYKLEEKKLKFKLTLPKSNNNLIGDPDKIKRIIANLLDNAIKYTEKGKVSLSIQNKIKNSNCDLTIIVEDTGIGIETKTRNNLFSNFNRSEEHMDSHISGMGLGLSITKSLVEMMNGKITYESKIGKGTKFIVQLTQKVGNKK